MPATQLFLKLPPTSAGARKLVSVTLSTNTAAEPLRRLGIALRGGRQRINMSIANVIAAMARSNFGPSGPFRPAPWAPYKRSYGPGKRKGGPATLIESGTLLASITASATPQKAIVTAEGRRNYAAAQQFGYRGRLPARPYFPVLQRGGTLILSAAAQTGVQLAFEHEVNRILGIR